MNPKTSARVLVLLSVAYGIAIGILGAFGSSAITPVAVVGALVLGGLWVARGVLTDRERSAN
jgi:predicted membrane-bound mannosyltransferase